jgi:hypothetical protein
MGWNGGPTKTGNARRVDKAKGQMSLGRVFLRSAAMMHVTNAMIALNGRSRMIEKSTLSFIGGFVRFPPSFCRSKPIIEVLKAAIRTLNET